MIREYTESYEHLFFLYRTVDKCVIFSSAPIRDFFESLFDPAQLFPFVQTGASSQAGLQQPWQECLQLKPHETGNFCWKSQTSAGVPVQYWFDAVGIQLPGPDQAPLVLFSVKKQKPNPRTSTAGKTEGISPKDYAEFIDLAAHDLDAPLRKASLLVDRVMHKYNSEPASDLRDYFDRLQASIGDMRTLLDDLSSWSAIGTRPGVRTDCNTNMLINEVLQEIRHKTPDKKISATCSALPLSHGDKAQYRQLFQQLLQNAVTFSRKDDEVQISITSDPVSDSEKENLGLPGDTSFAKIRIRDNGIGFGQEYAEKIFKPFIRLHGKSEYPGTGMGLAICKKIVEEHGGTIYAESKENEGATFTLILPQSHS